MNRAISIGRSKGGTCAHQRTAVEVARRTASADEVGLEDDVGEERLVLRTLRARAGVARHAGGAAIDATAAARSAVRVRRARVAVARWIAASRARPFAARAAGAPRSARPSRRGPSRRTASRGSARRGPARRGPARRGPARRRPARRGIARRSAPAAAVVPAVAGSRAVHGGAAAAARSCAATAAPDAGRRLAQIDGPVVARASPFHDARVVARRCEAAARASLGARAQKDEPG